MSIGKSAKIAVLKKYDRKLPRERILLTAVKTWLDMSGNKKGEQAKEVKCGE